MKTDNLIEHADQSALLNTQNYSVQNNCQLLDPVTGRAVIGDRLYRGDYVFGEWYDTGNYCAASLIVQALNATAGIQEPEKAIQGAREALERAVNAAQYAVRLIEANDKAGQSASPFEKADWIGTVAHIYGAMAFVTEARTALKQLGGKL